ncbi:hypothetical protein [uncultured Traorella sp.]|uniref:hypothetical protein n=1 Tax=uncultured Traorella sp. TaxID=1929048 RepID=UPI0025E84488|nr:hypothetical protein [uncultured Traorella sp.]
MFDMLGINNYFLRFFILFVIICIAILPVIILAVFQARLCIKNRKIFGWILPILSIFMILGSLVEGYENHYLNPFYFYYSLFVMIAVIIASFIKTAHKKKTNVLLTIFIFLFTWIFFDYTNIVSVNVDTENIQAKYPLRFDNGRCTIEKHDSLTNSASDIISCLDTAVYIDDDQFGAYIYISSDDIFSKRNILKELITLKKEEEPMTKEEWKVKGMQLQVYQYKIPDSPKETYKPYYRIHFSYENQFYKIYLYTDSFTSEHSSNPQIDQNDKEKILLYLNNLLE